MGAEPPGGDLGKDAVLAGDGLAHDYVEGADAVGGDEEEVGGGGGGGVGGVTGGGGVDIPDLAAEEEGEGERAVTSPGSRGVWCQGGSPVALRVVVRAGRFIGPCSPHRSLRVGI